MWINVGKQLINLDQVSRVEVAKSYLYLYGKDHCRRPPRRRKRRHAGLAPL